MHNEKNRAARRAAWGERMKRGILSLLGVAIAAAAGLVWWLYGWVFGERGWRPLHAAEFAAEGCEYYHVMRGLEQDPARDPANAALVARCRPQSQDVVWTLSQIGDALRFDRPSLIRLRIDGVDMNVEHHEDWPVIVVEFPYPPVPVERGAHWRLPTGPNHAMTSAEYEELARRWNPSWAHLLAEWSLGRGKHEVWLGRATIGDARHCAAVETSTARRGRMCVMHMTDYRGEPVTVRFPLDEAVEWRLEMLDICRFGGRERRWHDPLTAAWFGRVEYSDAGCKPYVS